MTTNTTTKEDIDVMGKKVVDSYVIAIVKKHVEQLKLKDQLEAKRNERLKKKIEVEDKKISNYNKEMRLLEEQEKALDIQHKNLNMLYDIGSKFFANMNHKEEEQQRYHQQQQRYHQQHINRSKSPIPRLPPSSVNRDSVGRPISPQRDGGGRGYPPRSSNYDRQPNPHYNTYNKRNNNYRFNNKEFYSSGFKDKGHLNNLPPIIQGESNKRRLDTNESIEDSQGSSKKRKVISASNETSVEEEDGSVYQRTVTNDNANYGVGEDGNQSDRDELANMLYADIPLANNGDEKNDDEEEEEGYDGDEFDDYYKHM